MRADRERQSMTIHDCHDFHAFSALRRSDLRPATLRHHERRIDEAFRFIQGASVEYPQYSFENTSGRDRPASRTSIGDVLFRKMIPDALPLLVCQPNHPTFIADRLRLAILR